MEKDIPEINKRILEVRNSLKINQKSMAEALGLKQSYYSEVENGKRKVTSRVVEGLGKKFKVSSDWLYHGNGEIFLTNSDNSRTPNAVPSLYPNETKEQKSDNRALQSYTFKFHDYVKENLPEYHKIREDIFTIFELEDVLKDLETSKIGKAVYFGLHEQNFTSFEAFKAAGIQSIKNILAHKSILHQFASFAGEFIAYLNAHNEELDYDTEPYIDLSDLSTKWKKD